MPSSVPITAMNVSLPAAAATGAVKVVIVLLFPAEQQDRVVMTSVCDIRTAMLLLPSSPKHQAA